MLLQEKSGNHQNDRDLSSGDHECLSKIQKFFIVVIVVDILVWTEEVDWLNEWHCHALGDAIRKANSKAKDYPVKTKHYPIVEETTWTLGTNVNSPFLSWAMKLLSIFPMWKDFLHASHLKVQTQSSLSANFALLSEQATLTDGHSGLNVGIIGKEDEGGYTATPWTCDTSLQNMSPD